jgi:nucleotide-binding universal stress UspA family protein
MKAKMKLLVGYDGSVCSDAALRDLRNAGLPSNVNAVVMTAADVISLSGPDLPVGHPYRRQMRKARESAAHQLSIADGIAKTGAHQLQIMFPEWRVQHEACADSPAWALIKRADALKADLISVGAHGHSTLGRFLGSVSQMILTLANCSVRIGRTCADPYEGIKVMIAIDGSNDSKAAVRAASVRCWPEGSQFLLLSVIDRKKSTFIERLQPETLRWFMEKAEDERDIFGRMLELQAKPLRDCGYKVTCKVRMGDAKRVLIDEAESWNAGSIFIGVRGLTHMKRLFVGGVSNAVAARAHCAVEVIRKA